MSEQVELQVAIFRVGQEHFALDIRYIREITRLEQISHVPSMPKFVEGVMELRGQIIPVVDLRKRLDAEIENGRKTRIVITRLERKPLGVIVDEVTDVWDISDEDISDAPSVGMSFQPTYLRGVLRRNEQIVFFLQFEELLSSTEKAKVEAVREKGKSKTKSSDSANTKTKKKSTRSTKIKSESKKNSKSATSKKGSAK